MQSARVVLTSIAVLTLVGCATQNDLEQVRRDSDEMKSRIFTLDKSVAEVRGEVKNGVERYLAGNKQNMENMQKEIQEYQKEMAALRKGSADLQATLDNARVDMQVLTGKVDDVRLLAQKPAEDLQMLKEDTSKRLAALEDRLLRLESGMTDLQKKMAEPPPQPQTPEALYQQGIDAMRRPGGAAKARDLFSRFLEAYPKHPLAANARYWLGETYYADKNYEQAILEFQEVIKSFPDEAKVPAAMLKQGMAFRELGDTKMAGVIFRRLMEQYPKSEEAKVAKEKLRSK